jgi:hypothetical protein
MDGTGALVIRHNVRQFPRQEWKSRGKLFEAIRRCRTGKVQNVAVSIKMPIHIGRIMPSKRQRHRRQHESFPG